MTAALSCAALASTRVAAAQPLVLPATAATAPENASAAPLPPLMAQPPPEPHPATRYATRSVTFMTATSLAAGFLGASRAGSPVTALGLSANLAVRFVLARGFTLQPRLGLDAVFAGGDAGIYLALALRPGLAVGWTFALTRTLAFTPAVAYDAIVLAGGVTANLAGLSHLVTAELPLTLLFGRHGVFEVYVSGGIVTLLGEVSPALGGGYRVGLTF